jgi:hypothetical protein
MQDTGAEKRKEKIQVRVVIHKNYLDHSLGKEYDTMTMVITFLAIIKHFRGPFYNFHRKFSVRCLVNTLENG